MINTSIHGSLLSGSDQHFAIESDHRNSEFPIKSDDVSCYVNLPEGTGDDWKQKSDHFMPFQMEK